MGDADRGAAPLGATVGGHHHDLVAEVAMVAARDAAYAARDTAGVARATGHAAATHHMAVHELLGCLLRASAVTEDPPGCRRAAWTAVAARQLPPTMADLVLYDTRLRLDRFRGTFDSVMTANHSSLS